MAKFSSEERFSYSTLKEFALAAHFDYCRDRAIVCGMSQLEVLTYISSDFEEGFERPLEDLMWQLILFILSGSWGQPWSDRQRGRISESLKAINLREVLDGVPDDEKEMFLMDLRILKFI